jgi:putative endonuclease
VDGRRRAAFGASGEAFAERYLTSRGLELIERDVRLKNGQIDLVMRDRDCLVVVEVKARRRCGFGIPAEAVVGRKLRKLEALAETYHLLHPELGHNRRIDVVAVELDRRGQPATCEHIPSVTE